MSLSGCAIYVPMFLILCVLVLDILLSLDMVSGRTSLSHFIFGHYFVPRHQLLVSVGATGLMMPQ